MTAITTDPEQTTAGQITTEQTTTKAKKKVGRKKATGRFDDRESLIDFVCSKYHQTPLAQAEIARMCQVSETTVANILDKAEGRAWLVAQQNTAED
jgi:DNA-binding transcriptional regulator LsrR (DeoR family)